MTGPFRQADSARWALAIGLGGLAGAGCVREGDPGGQEGEERWPQNDAELGTAEGEAGDTEAEDTGAGVADTSWTDGASGTRHHLRGEGERSDYQCDLNWLVMGTVADDWCADCSYRFDLRYTLDVEASERVGDACNDVYGDGTARVGIVLDYFGYGPMVVGQDPYTGRPYPLAPAILGVDRIAWVYGYVDEEGQPGIYGTWYWRVELAKE